jgi:hypothetical protein
MLTLLPHLCCGARCCSVLWADTDSVLCISVYLRVPSVLCALKKLPRRTAMCAVVVLCCAVCSFEAAEADCNAVLAFPQLAAEHRAKALLRRGTARIHKSEVAAAAGDQGCSFFVITKTSGGQNGS